MLQRLLKTELIPVLRLICLRGGGVAATFLMNLLIVRRFGTETNGLFQVGLGYVMIGAAAARVGQDQFNLRRMAELHAANDPARARHTLDVSLAVSAVPALLAAAGLVVAGFVGERGANAAFVSAFALTVLPWAWLWVITESMRGWQNVTWAIFWQGTFVPASFLILVAAMLFLPRPLLPYVYTGCVTVAAAGAYWAWRRSLRHHTVAAASEPLLWRATARDALRQGSTFWMLAILTNLAGWIDLLLIYAIADAKVVGVFQPIARTGSLIAVAIGIATAGLVARLALLYAHRSRDEFLSLLRRYWIAISLGSLVAGIALLVFTDQIAALWGPALLPYRREFSIYVVIQIFQSFFILAQLISPVIGLEKSLLLLQIINFPLRAAAVYVGFSTGGLMGVIVAIGVCTLITVLWNAVLFVRRLGELGIGWQALLRG